MPSEWGRMRYVRHSSSVGPSPDRARRTASPAASYTAATSLPSTSTPGRPYARAREATSGCRVALAKATSVAYRLFSHTNRTGSPHTVARLIPSWNEPLLTAPSPKKATATRSVLSSLAV